MGERAPDLRASLLALLAAGSTEARQLAERLNTDTSIVMDALTSMAWDGLVDAQDPPQPCGPEHLGWFLVRRVQRVEV